MNEVDDTAAENRETLIQEVERLLNLGVYTREEARQRLGLEPKLESMEKPDKIEMDRIEVEPTWSLTWGLWWRGILITLGIYAAIAIIFLIVVLLAGAAAFIPFMQGFWMNPILPQ